MILWNTMIRSDKVKESIISRMKKGSLIYIYSKDEDKFIQHKLASCSKTERRTPYRLRTENCCIDTYLNEYFLVKKENGIIVPRRLCDIRDTFMFATYNKYRKIVYEKYVSILQDPALMRHYDLKFDPPKGYDYYIANGFLMKRKES